MDVLLYPGSLADDDPGDLSENHNDIDGLDDDNTRTMVLMTTTRLPRVLTMITNLPRV